jgi:undecaprenyl-diphosphatase
MLILYTILFAIVQAITEFWPVSSSGHLIILHDVLHLDMFDSLTFDVALHVGTALALLLFFWKDVKRYFLALINLFRRFNIAHEDQKTVISLFLATIPAALAGFFLESYIESLFRNTMVVAIALIVGGILFFIVEKFSKKKLHYEGLSIPESLMIGVAQALALVPGVSRSGITIIAGMSFNLKRDQAAKFSFLLSIPIVLGAGLKKFFDINFDALTYQEIYIFSLGLIISLIAGYLVIKYFLRFLQKRSLNIFGIYRIILGLILLILLLK